uniref:Uncharacterized protein n=1 Tax=Arundo donax TaxID=35708 RepID=A0A0A9DSN9_ARUDO
MGRVPIFVAEEELVLMMLLWPVLTMKRMEMAKTAAKSHHLLRRAPLRKSRNDRRNGQHHVLHLLEQHAVMLLLMIRMM